jgi:hypothetical protein
MPPDIAQVKEAQAEAQLFFARVSPMRRSAICSFSSFSLAL